MKNLFLASLILLSAYTSYAQFIVDSNPNFDTNAIKADGRILGVGNNPRILLQSTSDADNDWTRGLIGNNIFWNSTNNTWSNSSSSSFNDFNLIRFENGSNIGFYAKTNTNSGIENFTNTEIEDYRIMTITNSGNVGIGVRNPNAKLQVDGITLLKPDVINNNYLRVTSNAPSQTNLTYFSNNDARWNLYSDNEDFRFRKAGTDSAEIMILKSQGNVGIGTVNPSELLTVNGKILCEEVEVIANVAPDYVFQKYYTGISSLKEDYVMPTLEEVEAFTKENHHLPEVPSADEIKEDGLQLKEMTTILLQKVEELTLYTIEQEKRIKALEIELAAKK
ncbi:hypothetical protein [Winogradskyella sp.]|uniref:hypothetical protein n=1 Tax=Winogradskyella sp. TaxID=1883156 RepID=UPI00260C7C31|nr:hypothetical protein [Winogradskyella sp.]